jgi:hypothetical protein
MRRLFWQLVAVGERSATRILHWSWWRQWHQAWARYYHYRQRQGQASPAHQQAETTHPPALLDVVWRRLAPLLPPTQRTGRPFAHDRRRVWEAIVYAMHSDGAWRTLPSGFPPGQTVYVQFSQWRRMGMWETIWAGLEQPYAPG